MNVWMNVAISLPRSLSHCSFCSSVPVLTTAFSASEKGVDPLYSRRLRATNRMPAAGARAETLSKMPEQRHQILEHRVSL